MSEILSIGELLDLGNSASTAGLIPYSALEYDGTGRISGISGSAIAGGVDSAVVSSIVSSYVSAKVDQSAFDDYCSSVQSALSGKLDASASSLFQPSGDYYSASNPSGFITGVDLSPYQEKSGMTAYQPAGDYALSSDVSSTVEVVANNSASWGGGGGGGDYTGITPIVVDNTGRTIGMSSVQLDVDGTMTSYLSGGITYFGVNESALNLVSTLKALSAWATANGWTGA